MVLYRKYKTIGHLFQDRFKSETVESDEYRLTIIRYIHQNPVKAQIVKRVEQWRWSSYLGYYGNRVYPGGLLGNDFILRIFSENRNTAIERFKQFNEQENDDSCLDDVVNERARLTDEEARQKISNSLVKLKLDK